MKDKREIMFIKILFFYIPLVIFFIFFVSFSIFLLTPVYLENPVIVEIPRGASLNSIVKTLNERGVVSDSQKFKLLARILGATKKVHPGEYEFKDKITPSRILKYLTKGWVKKYNITIPEGYTVKQIISLLSDRKLGRIEEFNKLLNDPVFLREWGLEQGLEGYLFPDTYVFYKGMEERDILAEMIKNFRRKLPPDAEHKASRQNLNLHEAITLASIVQKETYLKDEMPLVAQVFYNRLRRGIPLQADPTVIYAIPNFSGNLRKEDLRIKSPYNTYINRGLPPGPICNPGLDAINAVLEPVEGPYLYFVSRNDGYHEFSVSLNEHNKKVRIYQLKRRD